MTETLRPREASYHGIVLSLSQRNKSIFRRLAVIGKKKAFLGLVVLYKVEVPADKIERTIETVRTNMARRWLFGKKEFYAHFYRGDEVIIAFREKTFVVSGDPASWLAAIEFGKSLGIPEKQLDFVPHRIDQETY